MTKILGTGDAAPSKGRIFEIVGIAPLPGTGSQASKGDVALNSADGDEGLESEEACDHDPIKGRRTDVLKSEASGLHPKAARATRR